MLLKVGRIDLQEPYGDWTEHLLAQPGFAPATVNVRILAEAYYYPFPDPFDSVITATARVMDLPLLTNDAAIHAAQVADVYW
jgi:PIN domain nuclease of toxin-antitoxin system